MTLNLSLPQEQSLKPKILVVGVGGAGGNAVNNMISANLEGVRFIVANTDAQTLDHTTADTRIQLGEEITKGLGAGAKPHIGKAAAEESLDQIIDELTDAHMVFITAGMGGGTGTGASPVIARAAKERHILTVGVVTKPFHFEGRHRMAIAEEGIRELQQYVDTLIIIPNQNLFRIANEKTTFADAFKMADDVLYSGVRGITDLMIMPGLINLDFADIKTIMSEMGSAMMGTGEASGENRAVSAAEMAISNPLLDDITLKGARGVLINITGGSDLTLFETDEAANCIRDQIDENANIIFGSTFDENLKGKIRVSIVATGIGGQPSMKQPIPPSKNTDSLASLTSIQSMASSSEASSFNQSSFNHASHEKTQPSSHTDTTTDMDALFSSVSQKLEGMRNHHTLNSKNNAENTSSQPHSETSTSQQPWNETHWQQGHENSHQTWEKPAQSTPQQQETLSQQHDDVFIPSDTATMPETSYTSLEHPLGFGKTYTQENTDIQEHDFFMSHDLKPQEQHQETTKKKEEGMGLFKKMPNFNKKSKEEAATPTPSTQQGDLFQEEEQKIASTSTKDLLDIPAFLRRQAN